MKKILICILALLAVAPAAWGQMKKSAKRGVGENGFNHAPEVEALAPGVSWTYNWGTNPARYVASQLRPGGIMEFVPMCWNGGFSEQALRERFGKQPPDTHPARSAVLQAAKGLRDIEQEVTAYADYVELFTASLYRFLRLSSLVVPQHLDTSVLEDAPHTWAVAQHITGDVSIVNGIIARDEVFLALARRYGGDAVEDLKGDATDALEEFLNVVNGLYIVELANRKIEPDLDFPLANEDVIPRGSHQLLLRVYTKAGDFILVLSTDAFL